MSSDGHDHAHDHRNSSGHSHDHAHSHDHHGHSEGLPSFGGRLGIAAGVNVAFAVVQVVVGLAIGSVVVLADAAHQIVDALGLITALVAAVLASRPASSEMSFGWGKADALGGFVSSLLLLGSVVWIVYEATRRLLDPVEVDGGGVIAMGLIAIAVNGGSVWVLGHGHEHGHNHLSMRAARLHLLTDLAGSVIVVAAGLLLYFTTATWIDPVASLLVSLMVVRSTWRLLGTATAELLDRAPGHVDADSVLAHLSEQPGVEHVHHVHVRSLGQQRTSVTAHVVVAGEPSLHDAQQQIGALTSVLERDLGVGHATIQLECHACED